MSSRIDCYFSFPSPWAYIGHAAFVDVAIEVAEACGLPGKTLLERAASPEIAEACERNRQDAIAVGVFGSPGFVLNGEPFWRQNRTELLADALKSGRRRIGRMFSFLRSKAWRCRSR